jgi:type VI secretion system secreted protein Hcp
MVRISWLNRRGETIPANAKPFLIGRIARAWLGLACVVILSVAACSAQAQVDIFMSVGGTPAAMNANPQNPPKLPGTSTDLQYPKWVQLFSAQMGVGRGISLGGGAVTASDPSLSEVTITKLTDNTTPSLYILACGGTATVTQPIDYVTIDFRKTGSTQAFYRMQLQDVYISGVSTSGGSDVPSESVSLFFSRITWSYVPFDQSGKAGSPITKGWDVVKNAAF